MNHPFTPAKIGLFPGHAARFPALIQHVQQDLKRQLNWTVHPTVDYFCLSVEIKDRVFIHKTSSFEAWNEPPSNSDLGN